MCSCRRRGGVIQGSTFLCAQSPVSKLSAKQQQQQQTAAETPKLQRRAQQMKQRSRASLSSPNPGASTLTAPSLKLRHLRRTVIISSPTPSKRGSRQNLRGSPARLGPHLTSASEANNNISHHSDLKSGRLSQESTSRSGSMMKMSTKFSNAQYLEANRSAASGSSRSSAERSDSKV